LSFVHSDDAAPYGEAHVNSGKCVSAPPFSADSCAQSPTQVQFAACTAFGNGSRSSSSPEYMSVLFKRETGLTMSGYRAHAGTRAARAAR